jgi:hypothetical protein
MKRILAIALLALMGAACTPLSVPGTWVKTPPSGESPVEEDHPEWDCLRNGNGICGPLTAQINCSNGWLKIYDRFGTQVMSLSASQSEILPNGYMVLRDPLSPNMPAIDALGTVFPGNYNIC